MSETSSVEPKKYDFMDEARLIAASPDLLEALQQIAELDYKLAAVNGCAFHAVQIAKAAITKATAGRE